MNYLDQRKAFLTALREPSALNRAELTRLTDDWLSDLAAKAKIETIGGALVAVGGYGRGELSPGSDLDLLLLVDSDATSQQVSEVADALWYPIWDSGIALDHSVRNLATARSVASEDLKVALGLFDARTISGDGQKVDQLLSVVLADWRAFAPKRLTELYEWVSERTQTSGELAHLLEPNLKESYGGLRDITILNAIAASWVTDVDRGSIAVPSEFLLDVRDALHLVTQRSGDRLVLQEQGAVAEMLGFASVDDLLRAIGRSGRTTAYTCDLAWHRVLANTKSAKSGRLFRRSPDQLAHERRPLAEGVVLQDGQAVLARDVQIERDPALLLRAAAAAAQAGFRLAPHTATKISTVASAISVPWSAQNLNDFVSLIGAGRHTLPVWEALDQNDVFSQLIPEWTVVRSAPQHNPLHRFTVDRHLVETAIQASAYTRFVSRPDLLLVSALFHDIGKARPGDHSEVGADLMNQIAPRLGFNEADTNTLSRLVKLHLLLPDVATRRDLADPATIEFVVEQVASLEFLELLAALTVADAKATGPVAASAWRLGLVDELVARAKASFSGVREITPPDLASVLLDFDTTTQVQLRISEHEGASTITIKSEDSMGLLSTIAAVLSMHKINVRSASTQTIGKYVVSQWLVTPTFGDLPDAKLLEQDVRLALAGDIDPHERLRRRAAEQFGSGLASPDPVIQEVVGASATATVLEVRAHDLPGLLSRISAAISSVDVDIRAAKVATLGSDAIDVFYLVTKQGDKLSSEAVLNLASHICEAIQHR